MPAPLPLSALIVSALIVALFPAPAAAAKDYVTRDVGQWIVSASSDRQGCFLTRSYPAPRETTLMLGLDTDGTNRLTILNADWSVRERQQLKLDFRLSGAAFPRHLAVGLAADGKKGFVASFGRAFPATFAASGFLHVARGDVPVAELGLEGSGAAVAELRRCVSLYRDGRLATGSKTPEIERIPRDPFAQDSGGRSKK